MPRRSRPVKTSRSEHWLRVLVNQNQNLLNESINNALKLPDDEVITWKSPIESDQFAEYYDESFLVTCGINPDSLKVKLKDFWASSGPRWDGLAVSNKGKVFLVEAKAYTDEAVSGKSGAKSPKSIATITKALEQTKKAYDISSECDWTFPYYQYANRLAHLFFLNNLNSIETYLLNIYFTNAPDVTKPCSKHDWEEANTQMKKSLGILGNKINDNCLDLYFDVGKLK